MITLSSNDGRIDVTRLGLRARALHADAFLPRANYCFALEGQGRFCYLNERFRGVFWAWHGVAHALQASMDDGNETEERTAVRKASCMPRLLYILVILATRFKKSHRTLQTVRWLRCRSICVHAGFLAGMTSRSRSRFSSLRFDTS